MAKSTIKIPLIITEVTELENIKEQIIEAIGDIEPTGISFEYVRLGEKMKGKITVMTK